MIRWMESQGYDITYVTYVDLETEPEPAARPQGLREHRPRRVLLGQHARRDHERHRRAASTWRSSARTTSTTGSPGARTRRARSYRRIHCDKDALAGSTTVRVAPAVAAAPGERDRRRDARTASPATGRSSSPTPAAGSTRAPASTTYTGNGTTNVITSGAEPERPAGHRRLRVRRARVDDCEPVDLVASFEPSTAIHTVGHSFVPASDGNGEQHLVGFRHSGRAPSGAMIFSAGTIEWSFGVDDGYNDGYCGTASTRSRTPRRSGSRRTSSTGSAAPRTSPNGECAGCSSPFTATTRGCTRSSSRAFRPTAS